MRLVEVVLVETPAIDQIEVSVGWMGWRKMNELVNKKQ